MAMTTIIVMACLGVVAGLALWGRLEEGS
ncbi:hypothetical protein PPSIR1_30155 [Plesiocystis pacifica SIR-1]|uniref:Uncharacterized protein n=1 Tax=Plesiocystis pacifica SIR-1 TaxID=391625 RepID=A6FZ10_9BACT|nr:hypothetical protein PPSIR1_30155 [Plesiocystis pacifica SIR-1]